MSEDVSEKEQIDALINWVCACRKSVEMRLASCVPRSNLGLIYASFALLFHLSPCSCSLCKFLFHRYVSGFT
jgi:hypothetical protein